MNSRFSVVLILVFGFPLAPSTALATIELNLDQFELVQGAPLTGHIEIVAGSDSLKLSKYLNILDGGISFFVTTPSGKTVEISQRTSGFDIFKAPSSGYMLPPGCRYRVPVILFKWGKGCVFSEVGNHVVGLEVFTTENKPALACERRVEVVQGYGNQEKWGALFGHSIVAPFFYGYVSFDKMLGSAAQVNPKYEVLLKQLWVYGGGTFEPPNFFIYEGINRQYDQEKLEGLLSAVLERRELAIEIGIGAEMWQYFEEVIRKFLLDPAIELNVCDRWVLN